MDIQNTIQNVVDRMNTAVSSVAGQIGKPKPVLTRFQQVKKYREMTVGERLALRDKVGEYEYARY